MVGCTYEKEELDNDEGKRKKSRGSSPEMRWGTERSIKGRQGPETRDLTKGERSLLLLALKTERERGGVSAESISTTGWRRIFTLSRRAKGEERDLGVPSLGEKGVVEEPLVKPYCTNSKRGRVE
jgi:hypothetical protein